jgi:hypothetical protein
MTAPEPRRWRQLFTVPLSLVLIVATVLVGSEIIKRTPDFDEGSRPYVHTGHIGGTVDGLTFSVVVDSVRGAGAVRARFNEEYRTDGVFVAVRAKVTAYSDGVQLKLVAVVDRAGRRYDATERLFQDVGAVNRFQPAIPVTTEILFEIPRDAGPGLAMQLSANEVLDNRNQTIAQVDLGIDRSMVDGWLAEPEPLELKAAEVVA